MGSYENMEQDFLDLINHCKKTFDESEYSNNKYGAKKKLRQHESIEEQLIQMLELLGKMEDLNDLIKDDETINAKMARNKQEYEKLVVHHEKIRNKIQQLPEKIHKFEQHLFKFESNIRRFDTIVENIYNDSLENDVEKFKELVNGFNEIKHNKSHLKNEISRLKEEFEEIKNYTSANELIKLEKNIEAVEYSVKSLLNGIPTVEIKIKLIKKSFDACSRVQVTSNLIAHAGLNSNHVGQQCRTDKNKL